MADNITKIREYIFDNFLFDAESADLKNEDSFFDQGIIDSTGVLELAEWLEDKCGIEVDDEELIPENFDSVNNLAVFIAKKTD